MLVDWSRPIETAEASPRAARVLGEGAGGAIEYMRVLIGDGDSRYRHPPGEYCAGKTSGFIRGTLAVRNCNT